MSVCLSLCGGACVGGGGLQHAPEHVPACCSVDVEKPGKDVPFPVLAPLPAIQVLSVSPFPILWLLIPAYCCSLREITTLYEWSLSMHYMHSLHSPSNAGA